MMHKDTSKAAAEAVAGRRRICRATAEYRAAYADPFTVSAGDELAVSERESEWNGWLWCTDRDGESRWVPEPYVERRGGTGVVLCDYDATELSVRAGEELIAGIEVSDWIWCTNREGKSGWVPARNLDLGTAGSKS
jgi:hypothetical protein